MDRRGTQPRATTAAAVNAPAPSARPPQAVLIAVTPDGGDWTLDRLRDAVIDTLQLAQERGVTLERVPPRPDHPGPLRTRLVLAGTGDASDGDGSAGERPLRVGPPAQVREGLIMTGSFLTRIDYPAVFALGAGSPSWTRLEPQSVTGDPTPGLEARVHDPLWLLCRQWQLGELKGEDAGSPLGVELSVTSHR